MVKNKGLIGLAALGIGGSLLFLNRDKILPPPDQPPPEDEEPPQDEESEPVENISSFTVSPRTGVSPLTVLASIEVRDPRSDIVWIWGDGERTFDQLSTSHEYFRGTYNGRVEVIDSNENKEVQNFKITVSKPPTNGDDPTPIKGEITGLDISPDSGVAPLQVTGTVSVSRQVSSIVWDWGEGTPTAGGSSDTHVYEDRGTFNGKVTVTFDNGDVDSRSFTVSVASPNQVEVTGIRVFQDIIEPGDTVFFELQVDGGLVGDVSVDWKWGDGTRLIGVLQEEHVYDKTGNYKVTAELSLDGKVVGSASTIVTVESAPLPGDDKLEPGDIEARSIIVSRIRLNIDGNTNKHNLDFDATIRKNVPGAFSILVAVQLIDPDGAIRDGETREIPLSKTTIDHTEQFTLFTSERGEHTIRLMPMSLNFDVLDTLDKQQFI